MASIYLGRQPIFDSAHAVTGYELLFRSDPNALAADDAERATAQVIVNTFMEFGVEAITGDRLPFVNVTRPFLTGDVPLPFQPGAAVLEILETVPAEPELVEHVRRMSRQGHRFALDDFGWQDCARPLLDVAEIVKLDVLATGLEQLPELVSRCREHDVALVAEKVETAEQLAACQALGFEYYQGYLLARPVMLRGRGLEPAKLACLDLMAALGDPRSSVAQIESRLRLDPALTYRVLRVVNSAAGGLRRRVSSVREAVVLLGRSTLRAWVLMMALADASPMSTELLTRALTRARMCELLCEQVTGVAPDVAFTAGLLSALDLLLGGSLLEITRSLPLDDALRAALLGHEGMLGGLLGTVLAYENAEPAALWPVALPVDEVRRAYVAATGWAGGAADVVAAADAPVPAAG